MRHILFFHLPVSLRQDGPLQRRVYRGFALNPPPHPLRQNYLISIRIFIKVRKIDKQTCNKSNPFVNLNPLSRNPGSAPALIYIFFLGGGGGWGGPRYDNFPNYCISFQDKQSDHRGLPISYF